MKIQLTCLIAIAAILSTSTTLGQDGDEDSRDELRIAALEALVSAPAEFALPRVRKILEENNSDEVKESALFILSQIDSPEAAALLLETARNSSGDLQTEAIEMIGIGGDSAALSNLRSMYDNGDGDVREAVLEAYLIANDSTAIYEIAINSDGKDFEAAVEMLGAMGASDELRMLREQSGMSEVLMEAYAISGDYDTIVALATDDSDPELQAQAIEYLGLVGGDDVGPTLVEIYQNADGEDHEDIREAALNGMLIADYDTGVLQLYRGATSSEEKSELLQYLTMMESEGLWEIIDSALEGER